MSGKTISHPGGEWKLRVLLYLICFVLPVAWMLRTVDAFGMETETDTDCTIFLYMCGSNLESEYGLACIFSRVAVQFDQGDEKDSKAYRTGDT